MDSIRSHYNPYPQVPTMPADTNDGVGASGDVRVYGGHVFQPHIHHSNISYAPPFVPEKKVALHLEPDYNIIFQHVPQFVYQPGSSNIDAYLPDQ